MNEEQIVELILLNIDKSNCTIKKEFRIGKSIADLVVIRNDFVTVFEVKSEYDNLKRLESQIENYSKFADNVYLVCAEKHLDKAYSILQYTTTGLFVFEGKQGLLKKLPSLRNQDYWEFDTIFKLLRKPEYLAITKQYYGFIPDVPNTQIYKECFEMLKEIPLYHFRNDVITQIRMRKK